jgi:hypothetical protein
MFCANFALHPEIVRLQCIILQETSRFPELAAAFHESGIMRAAAACGFPRDMTVLSFESLEIEILGGTIFL